MFFKRDKESDGISKSILAAYAILLLHVFLIAGIGFLIFFFSGIVNYLGWIFLIGFSITGALAYRFYRRMKREGKTVYEMMQPSLLNGRSVELSVMGGLISFKVGGGDSQKAMEALPGSNMPLLEDPDAKQMEDLAELVRLLEGGLITREEYNQAKKSLFHRH